MSPEAERMFAQAVRLPQIPRVMQEVVNSLKNEKVSVAELAALVGNDQVISAKVLRLANSSHLGAGRNVASISGALQLIGMNAFRNLVIASSLVGVFPKVEGFDLPAFWRKSMLVANLAHIVGRDLPVDREALFSAGLLSGIGQLLIYLCYPDAAAPVALALRDAKLAEQRALEQKLLNMDHFEVGAELARRWNFPMSIQSAIASHDAPAAADLPARSVQAAVLIAAGIQASLPLADIEAMLPPELAREFSLDRAWLEEEAEVFDLLLQESDSLV